MHLVKMKKIKEKKSIMITLNKSTLWDKRQGKSLPKNRHSSPTPTLLIPNKNHKNSLRDKRQGKACQKTGIARQLQRFLSQILFIMR